MRFLPYNYKKSQKLFRYAEVFVVRNFPIAGFDCVQASKAAVNSTLNSFRFKSDDVFIATNNYPTRSDKAYSHPHPHPHLPFALALVLTLCPP